MLAVFSRIDVLGNVHPWPSIWATINISWKQYIGFPYFQPGLWHLNDTDHIYYLSIVASACSTAPSTQTTLYQSCPPWSRSTWSPRRRSPPSAQTRWRKWRTPTSWWGSRRRKMTSPGRTSSRMSEWLEMSLVTKGFKAVVYLLFSVVKMLSILVCSSTYFNILVSTIMDG